MSQRTSRTALAPMIRVALAWQRLEIKRTVLIEGKWFAANWMQTVGICLIGAGICLCLWSFVAGACLAGLGFVLAVAAPVVDVRLAVQAKCAEFRSNPLPLVVAYLRDCIEKHERDMLGDGTPIPKTIQALEAHAAEALTLVRAFEKRVSAEIDADAEVARRNMQDAQVIHDSVTGKLAELRQHADALRAFFAAARHELAALTDKNSDVGLKARLADLRASATETEAAVDAVIAASIERLQNALNGTREHIVTLIEETGLARATALPPSGNIERDITRVDEMVDAYLERARALDLPQLLKGDNA